MTITSRIYGPTSMLLNVMPFPYSHWFLLQMTSYFRHFLPFMWSLCISFHLN